MAIKKSELYSSLWASCDELRGGMDASQYKDYVLVMLFIKYVSDKYAGQPYAPIKIPPGASFQDMVALKGTSDIGDQVNKKIIAPLKNANKLSDLPDFNDATKLGSGKEMVDRLTNLIAIFENPALDFSRNRAEGDDILGDAYEYLMRHFATESGKSKGQFYTPAEVSRVMAQIIGIGDAVTSSDTTVYDPTCGSGSLLLKVADEASTSVTLYGQEKDATTSGLARMNMILHDNPTALIMQGNTLSDPKFKDGELLKTFDFVVANPPFSDKRWSNGVDLENDPHERFKPFGTPPGKQGDYAYLLHLIRSLKSSGKGACILPHGVLFRGNAEAEIRRNLVRKGYIKGIIGLPANLFYGTGIPACLIVVDKENAHERGGIFMVDASGGFMKDGNKNRLRSMDIHRIVDVFHKGQDVPGYARKVSLSDIEANEYNLNLPRYIDSQETEDVQDIEAHLRGGIPEADVDALKRYWQVCPSLRGSLFSEKRPGYSDLIPDKDALKASIYEHPEFKHFTEEMTQLFDRWQTDSVATLRALDESCKPKEVIAELSENLLAHYKDKPLTDPYDVYQHLMDYWAATMQDDLYLIAVDGWQAKPERIIERDKKGKEKDKGWACDLVPKGYIVARYFAEEQEAITELEAELDSVGAHLTELEEEQGGDEGALSSVANKSDAKNAFQDALTDAWQVTEPETYSTYGESAKQQVLEQERVAALESDPRIQALKNSKGNITKTSVKNRLKEDIDASERELLETYQASEDAVREAKKAAKTLLETTTNRLTERLTTHPDDETLSDLRVLDAYLELGDSVSKLKSVIKEAEAELDDKALAKYAELSEEDVKTLVICDKWLAALRGAVTGETERVSQALTRRVKELAERYEEPVSHISSKVEDLESKVQAHLEKMGFGAS